VGVGLQDHPTCFLVWRTPATRNLWEEPTPDNLALWQRERRGPMASSGLEAGGFSRSKEGLAAPDLQFVVADAPPPLPDFGPPTQRMASMIVWALDVRSRGRVALNSADPSAEPLIDPGYLAEAVDLEMLAAGVRRAREIAAQPTLTSIFAGEVAPGEQVDDGRQLRNWVRGNATTIFHPTSSCAMGGNEQAVCDPQLRVRGVQGLRIVDASVMPAAPRGNTNAPTIAIAERAADLMRGNTPLAPADLAAPSPISQAKRDRATATAGAIRR
jgi:choline dehydrogenase